MSLGSRAEALFKAFVAFVLCVGLMVPSAALPSVAWADESADSSGDGAVVKAAFEALAEDEAVTQTSHSVAAYREAEYGTPPDGVESSDGMHILVALNFDDEVSISDEEALDESLLVELNGTDIADSSSVSEYTVYAEGNSLYVDMLIYYASFAGRVGVYADTDSDVLEGVTAGGKQIVLEEFETLADTGLQFEAIEVIEGTDSTCASTTFQVTQSAVIRSMNHIIWLTTAGSEDGTGSSIIANSGSYSQSTVAHHHNFWSFTYATSAQYIVDGGDDTLATYGYTLVDNEDGTFTITADTPVAGEILWATNYTDSFFNETGLAYGEDVTGVEMPEPTDIQVDGHTLTAVEAKDATCTEDGNIAYYECTDCGKLFADVDATEELTLEDVTIPATGHDIVYVEAADPTCGDDGCYAHYECLNCGLAFSDAEGQEEVDIDDVTIPSLGGHTLSYVEAVDATCTEAGSIACYQCAVCGHYFEDENGETELSEDEVTVAALGHDYVVTESQEGSCTEDGYATYVCSRCGDSYTETNVATGHNYELMETSEATCTEDGYYFYVCSKCSDNYYETIEATGHDYWASWAWSDDYDAATLTLTCWTCGSTVEGIEGVVSSEELDGGYILYTATATVDGVEYVGDVTVEADDSDDSSESERSYFTDVPASDSGRWYFDEVYAMTDAGYITGYSDGSYGVGDTMKRCDFALIVYRMNGSPEASTSTSFSDVSESAYYADAVAWANENGVVAGYSDDEFGPQDTITFQQVCNILARLELGGDDALQAYYASDSAAEAVYAGFSDADKVGDSYVYGMAYCVESGLVEGNADGTLGPKDDISRERAAVLLARYAGLA